MKLALTLLALAALASLIGVSIWATGHQSIVPALASLWNEPAAGNNAWFWATLADAYFGFLWFYAWIFYKETSWLARLVWLPLVLSLGNMTMAVYMLIQLYQLPPNAKIEDLLLRRAAR